MPDTRGSGDGSGPPPAPAFARQVDGWFSGAGFRRISAVLQLATAMTVVAWPPWPQNAPLPETVPPPTEAEMERFCSRYEEVKNLSFSEMAAALVDYAPDSVMFDDEVFWDVKSSLVVASEQPLLAFRRGQGRIFDFIAHCPSEAGVPSSRTPITGNP